jgi:hypothetical protein
MIQKMTLGIITVVLLLLVRAAPAQGVLCVSNLGQAPFGSAAIGSDSWIAQTFVTGNHPGGYALNSVQLLTDASSGTPGGFSVSIYSKTGDPHSFHTPGDEPQTNLASLSGPGPDAGGIFVYTNPTVLLSPSTFYFLVVTSAEPVSVGAYYWSAARAFTQSNGFTIDDTYFASTNGSSWTLTIRQDVFQLGLYATAVPPPNLACAPDGSGGATIFWPNLGSYTLQQNTDLNSSNWVVSNLTVTNNALTNFCVVPPGTGNLFFRLKQ